MVQATVVLRVACLSGEAITLHYIISFFSLSNVLKSGKVAFNLSVN